MTDKNTAGVDLDKPEQALEVITSRLALTYRICCGLAPKQAVGELLDVAINMPEWEIVRAALRQTAPEAPTYVLSEGELKRLRRVLTLLGVAGSEELDTETSMACLWSLMQELIRKLEAAPAPAAQQAEAAPGEKFASSAVRMQQFIGATTASASERNQCDGCAQGASTNERGNHIDTNGRPFMSCQSHRYRAPAPSRDAAPLPAFKISRFSDTKQRGVLVTFERRLSDDELEAVRAALARAPLPAQGDAKPVGVVGTMPGSSGFTMACFKAADVPVGTKLYLAAPAQAGDARDSARWRETLKHVGGAADPQRFVFRWLPAVDGADIMRGSVAEHFTNAIDAAMSASQGTTPEAK